ncbi:MAG: hypothetical protein JW855_00525 [Gammaproteobacteria bacterium]|nr:hypothetical protein [Gammaproteobacteria bacterium]
MNAKKISSKEKANKTLALVIYILQAVAFFNGITAIIGVIINYIKLDEVKGTWLESHFRWQITTFWFALLWTIIGVITFVFFIGMIILALNSIWVIYRIIKGWLRLNENQPVF